MARSSTTTGGQLGHCGNFTQYQTRVPLIVHVPGAKPRRVTEVTTHVDVPTTLLKDVFGCGEAASLRALSRPCPPVSAHRPRMRARWWKLWRTA